MNNYKLLCRYLGGSHAAKLNTPDSDKDYRGCYISTDLPTIVALGNGRDSTGPVVTSEETTDDVAYYELRHFLHMLRVGNSNAMELMFNQNWDGISPQFKNIQKHRYSLISPEQVYRSTKGYALSEYELAQGNRTGKLGGKRQSAVEQYGFSPKNFANLFKILTAAINFFEHGYYLVSLEKEHPFVHMMLKEIREHPERYTKPQLEKIYQDTLARFEKAWEDNKDRISKEYHYSESTAAKLVAEIYLPQIEEALHVGPIQRMMYFIYALVDAFPLK